MIVKKDKSKQINFVGSFCKISDKSFMMDDLLADFIEGQKLCLVVDADSKVVRLAYND